jgi:hypothetical protein
MEKPTLYLSSFCKYSKELSQKIDSLNLTSKFNHINIDDYSNIPKFVNRVPLMYYDNKILLDESLFNYIDSVYNREKTVSNENLMECSSTNGNALSDPYSYLNGDFSNTTISRTYSQISDYNQKIYTPPDDESKNNKKTFNLDEIISNRNLDVKNI